LIVVTFVIRHHTTGTVYKRWCRGHNEARETKTEETGRVKGDEADETKEDTGVAETGRDSADEGKAPVVLAPGSPLSCTIDILRPFWTKCQRARKRPPPRRDADIKQLKKNVKKLGGKVLKTKKIDEAAFVECEFPSGTVLAKIFAGIRHATERVPTVYRDTVVETDLGLKMPASTTIEADVGHLLLWVRCARGLHPSGRLTFPALLSSPSCGSRQAAKGSEEWYVLFRLFGCLLLIPRVVPSAPPAHRVLFRPRHLPDAGSGFSGTSGSPWQSPPRAM